MKIQWDEMNMLLAKIEFRRELAQELIRMNRRDRERMLAKQAAEYADSVCGKDSGTENHLEWSGRWNRVYHDEITRLAKLKGWPA